LLRLIVRPAPWHVLPKVCAMLPGVPTSTQLAVPIDPGTLAASTIRSIFPGMS